MNRRKIPLLILQISWVLLAIVIVIQTVLISWIGEIERITLWSATLPQLMLLIGAMGSFAFGGPLLSDKINGKIKSDTES